MTIKQKRDPHYMTLKQYLDCQRELRAAMEKEKHWTIEPMRIKTLRRIIDTAVVENPITLEQFEAANGKS